MRKAAALVGVCLLFGFFAGITIRPDDGTQVSISPASESGAAVSGANHGKPLPRIPTPDVDLVRHLLALSVCVAALVHLPGLTVAVRDDRLPQPRALLLARARPRRGPPARA